jgi:hypothetical protein
MVHLHIYLINESGSKIMDQFHPSKSTWAIILLKKPMAQEVSILMDEMKLLTLSSLIFHMSLDWQKKTFSM